MSICSIPLITGIIVGGTGFLLGWVVRAAWGPLFGKSYEDGNDGEVTNDGET